MTDETVKAESTSPALGIEWFNSRWGPEDQRGNGNLMSSGESARSRHAHSERRDHQPGHAI